MKVHKILSSAVDTEDLESAQDHLNKYRKLKTKVKPGQTATIESASGKEIRYRINSVNGPRVFLKHPSLGMLFADITQLYPGVKSHWKLKLPSEANMETAQIRSDELKIFGDMKLNKIASDLYKNIISNEDYSKYPGFLMDLDNLVSEYRDALPFKGSSEYLDDSNDSDQDDDYEDSDDYDSDDEKKNTVISSLYKNLSHNDNSYNIAANLGMYIEVANDSLKAVERIKSLAKASGFEDARSMPPASDGTYILSMINKGTSEQLNILDTGRKFIIEYGYGEEIETKNIKELLYYAVRILKQKI